MRRWSSTSYTFVTFDGIAEIICNKPTEIYKWAKIIAARYMGNDKAKSMAREIVQKENYW